MTTTHLTLVWAASAPLARAASTSSSGTTLASFATNLAGASTFACTLGANVDHVTVVGAVTMTKTADVPAVTPDANVGSWHFLLDRFQQLELQKNKNGEKKKKIGKLAFFVGINQQMKLNKEKVIRI